MSPPKDFPLSTFCLLINPACCHKGLWTDGRERDRGGKWWKERRQKNKEVMICCLCQEDADMGKWTLWWKSGFSICLFFALVNRVKTCYRHPETCLHTGTVMETVADMLPVDTKSKGGEANMHTLPSTKLKCSFSLSASSAWCIDPKALLLHSQWPLIHLGCQMPRLYTDLCWRWLRVIHQKEQRNWNAKKEQTTLSPLDSIKKINAHWTRDQWTCQNRWKVFQIIGTQKYFER